MLALQLDNLLFLLLLALAGLFQLLAKAASKKNEQDQTTPTATPRRSAPKPIPRAGPQSDAERIRKFLEALGQPPAQPPPPPVAPRPTYRKPLVLPRLPRVRPFASPLPPLVTRPPDVAPEIHIPPATAPVAVELREKHAPSVEPAFEVHEAPPLAEPASALAVAAAEKLETRTHIAVPHRKIGVTDLLRSSSALRDAIIVREILGPPRGLRASELL
jgi:hypothetical protein